LLEALPLGDDLDSFMFYLMHNLLLLGHFEKLAKEEWSRIAWIHFLSSDIFRMNGHHGLIYEIMG